MKIADEKTIAAVSHFFRRYHLILYTLTIVVAVAAAIWVLAGALTVASNVEPATVTGIQFDKKTIEALDTFNESPNQAAPFTVPPGRVNPFAE